MLISFLNAVEFCLILGNFIEFFLRHIEFQTFQSVKNTLFGYFKNTFEWLGYFAKYQ